MVIASTQHLKESPACFKGVTQMADIQAIKSYFKSAAVTD